MFFFNFGDLAGDEPLHLIGASPEMHVRLEGRVATIRPIAGTRPRGKSEEEDAALELDLLADAKERAEHVMLVDLARNDLGRVCEYGTRARARADGRGTLFARDAHRLAGGWKTAPDDLNAFDLMRATFPAGTVSGAPKIRAMQIIDALEAQPARPVRRGSWLFCRGRFDGYVHHHPHADDARQTSERAGRGGDRGRFRPEREYQETLNKARALAVAVEMAEKVIA